MEFGFAKGKKKEFLSLNSFMRAFALLSLASITFGLTFLVFPFAEWKLHFYQAGIFTAGFLFGPLAGASVGALSSSYNALYVLHNPWIIGGNAILGFAAAYFYTRMHPLKAALAGFAAQVPYLLVTDIYLTNMPVPVVAGITLTLLVANIICALAAWKISETAAPYLAKN